MNALAEGAAFERGVQPIFDLLIPDHESDIVNLRPDSALAARIEELARKSNEGELSEDEYAEYQGYIRANKFVALLQRRARRSLKSRTRDNE